MPASFSTNVHFAKRSCGQNPVTAASFAATEPYGVRRVMTGKWECNMKCLCPNRGISWIVFAVIAVGIYFVNIEAQSYLGRRAIENTQIVSFPFDEARAQAEREGKIVLVDVSAVWCSNCRRLDNDVFSNPDVRQTINDKYIFSRIEYESKEGQIFLKALRNVRIPKPLAYPVQWNYHSST